MEDSRRRLPRRRCRHHRPPGRDRTADRRAGGGATRSPSTRRASRSRHEALIRQWPRLREWLDESRDELRLEREVARRAARVGPARSPRSRTAARCTPRTRARHAPHGNPGAGLSRGRARSARPRRARRDPPCPASACAARHRLGAPPDRGRGGSRRARPRAGAPTIVRPTPAPRPSWPTCNGSRPSRWRPARATSVSASPLAVEAFHLQDRYETRNALLSVLQRGARVTRLFARSDRRLRPRRNRAGRQGRGALRRRPESTCGTSPRTRAPARCPAPTRSP